MATYIVTYRPYQHGNVEEMYITADTAQDAVDKARYETTPAPYEVEEVYKRVKNWV